MQDKKIKKSLIIESRLKLLSLALQHKDSDIVEVIISKVLEQNDLDKQVVDIISNIEFNMILNLFEHSINEINDYLNKKPTTIVKYEDKELKELKQQLKKLEIKFQELIEEKTEYLNDIEEFNTQYSLHVGDLIKTILNLKKEILYKKTIKNQKLKKQYKANKDICDEIKQTIVELKNTVTELEEILETLDKDDENYEEISNAYNEIKEELEKLENELILQEEKLEKTEEELIENEIFEEEYEEAKATYEQFDDEYEHIKDTQKDVIKLDEEQLKELKILYKKAAKLCHPDIVADELKEKAHEIMQSLNDAYSKKNIEQVKKILLSLENGTTFKTVSSDIEDKELLLNKIKEFEQNISDLEDEIEHIKLDDTFTTITQLDNWDEYFEELKNELTEQKDNLEKEAMEVLEDENKDISKEKEIIIEKHKTKNLVIQKENSDYSKYIKSIENIKFEKIRKYCENLSKDNSTDDMQKYLAQNGKMYKALIYDALEQFISKLDNQTITLIDWGSNQGIASMLVLDYIKEKQFDIKVSQVILVDDDTKILSRAMAQVEALSQDNIQIIAIKNDDDNLLDKIKTNTIALNLFANDKIPMDVKVINDVIYKDFIICLSNENIEFVDKIYNDFNNSTNIQDLSIRDGNIGRYQRYERIFKLIN